MRSSHTLSVRKLLALVFILCACYVVPASAQTDDSAGAPKQQQQRPTVFYPTQRPPARAARQSESMCGGFIEQQAQAGAPQIVGAEQEQERRIFGQGNLLFVDAGSQQGVRMGQEFDIVRPRGQFRSKFSHKRGPLGVFTQEVGRLRIVRVRDRVSVGEVTFSCGDVLLGDMLRPAPSAEVPAGRADADLDRFAEPTGKQTGHIVLARDGREVLSRDQVVFIDLGTEDNVKAGDYLTVFRPLGHGTIVNYGDELAVNSRGGFQSNELRGGGFSNQSQRVKDVNGSKSGATVKTPSIKRHRPPVPRKVVGELVVIHVEGRTATAVITRVAQEIHTGDAVELQ